MIRDSLAIRFASESNPQLAMQRKRRPLTSPTSTARGLPSASVATAWLDVVGDPDHAREVVAATSRDHTQRRRRPGERAADLADQPVAAHDDRNITRLRRLDRLPATVLDALGEHEPILEPGLGQRPLGVGEQLLRAAAAGHGVDEQQVSIAARHCP